MRRQIVLFSAGAVAFLVTNFLYVQVLMDCALLALILGSYCNTLPVSDYMLISLVGISAGLLFFFPSLHLAAVSLLVLVLGTALGLFVGNSSTFFFSFPA